VAAAVDPHADPLLQLQNVSKRFGGTRALVDAKLVCARGRIHAVLGENGAGKSTLIKIMSGVVQPDAGSMLLEGRPVSFRHPSDAAAAGVVSVFQELSLLPDLTVADNIAITGPPTRFGFIDRRAQRRLAEEALARVGAEDIHPLAPVKELALSRRQLVEIAKALCRAPKLLILDEATSALTAADVTQIFEVLRRLRGEGLAIIYISHRMHEISEIADECTVFRNGSYVTTFDAGTKDDAAIVEMMIGREYKNIFPPKPKPHSASAAATPASVLHVENLSWAGRLHQIDLDIRPGEVVGLGGLDGQGQRELLLALFGVLGGVTGRVDVAGRRVSVGSPCAAASPEVGMALIPEDRKTEGLMLPMTVRDNLSFSAIDRLSRFGLVDRPREDAAVAEIMRLLQVRATGTDVPVASLSGGNQQKVVIGKWLLNRPRIILLNDPTRGIDVGTKQEIYQLLRKLADEGVAILFYSTDYDELVGCCDRVLVLYDGAVARVLEGDEITEHDLVSSALNLPGGANATRRAPGDAADRGAFAEDKRGRASSGRARDWTYRVSANRGPLFAAAIFLLMYAVDVSKHPGGSGGHFVNTAANNGALLALVAMAQTIPILTSGLDLSVGNVFVLANCLASTLVVGSSSQTILGIFAVLATGSVCGAVNGAIVVYGRIQPIIATISSGAVYYGFALLLRPTPGGAVNPDLAAAATGSVYGIPASLLALLAVLALLWMPYRHSVLGRAAYAVGSSEPAAYMSGVPIARARFCAYVLAGLLSAGAGLMLTFVTYSGEANAALGGNYTLNSIAAVVVGGTSLFGGSGGVVGSILGAFALRAIGDLLFVFDMDPLWQPLFLGVVLLVAVSLGSFRLLGVKNRLDVFG
jgi:ribose transport system ATP-binding protein